MKYLFLFILFSFSALANVSMELSLSSSGPKQGEIISGRLIIKETQGQSSLSGLRGKNFQKTLYLLNLSPFTIKGGFLEADVKVIFLKVPEGQSVKESIGGQEVTILWNDITVETTEGAESFLLADFDIPKKKQLAIWIVSLVVLLVIVLIGWRLILRNKKKNAIRLKKLALKEELLNCQSYEEVVSMWQKKLTYLGVFPQFEKNFKVLEEVLFKYQFRATQTDDEKSRVMLSYRKFKTDIMEGKDGV